MTEKIAKSSQQISEKKQSIKYDTRDYVIGYLKKIYEEGNLYVPLEYQRQFVWGPNNKCFFIESVLMGLPIPFMFFADTEDGRVEIVDGAQRTQILIEFMQGDLTLDGLGVLSESNGMTYNDLDPAVQRRFENTNIRVVFLEEGTTESVRQEIFKRINTSGMQANPAEVRRGAIDGPFMDFLQECTNNKMFNRLAPRSEQTEKRFEGFELVSRFFAYYDNYDRGFVNYNGEVAKYIDSYIECMNNDWMKEPRRQEYENIFENMLQYAEKSLGQRGFRKKIGSNTTPRARFEALAVGIALALKQNPDLPVCNMEWLDCEEFTEITRSDAANNKKKLQRRIRFVKENLLGDK